MCLTLEPRLCTLLMKCSMVRATLVKDSRVSSGEHHCNPAHFAAGRTLSGQTNEAFWNSVAHSKPFAVGLNCALGASDMKKYVANLSACADCWVFCYPNAGLPNAMGGYDQKGPEMAEEIRPFCEERLVNAIGGCCGSGPEHIAAIK